RSARGRVPDLQSLRRSLNARTDTVPRRSTTMTRILRCLALRRPGPALAFCALALLVAALRSPAAAALPAVVPLAWCRNARGQLGYGPPIDRGPPLSVSNLANVVAVTGGEYHSLALKADGTVFAWGGNDYGQLGNGTFTDRTVPVPVSGLAGVV